MAMRQIVVGRTTVLNGVSSINVWFRFPVVGAARQSSYAGTYTPQAPGDYPGVDGAEVTAFQNGSWIERSNFTFVLDPAFSVATIQASLASIYNTAKASNKAADDAALANWASSYDGTAWTMKSA